MAQDPFIKSLQEIVGGKHVLTADGAMQRYCAGYRFGGGKALAVVRPGKRRLVPRLRHRKPLRRGKRHRRSMAAQGAESAKKQD